MSGRKHPHLSDVIEEGSSYEWISLSFSGFGIADQVDSENFSYGSPVTDDLDFWLKGTACRSDFGTYSFESVRANLSSVDSNCLENLVGDYPLGLINYYEPEFVNINLPLKSQIYNNLLSLIASDIKLLNIRVAIPIWKVKEAKVLPILKYQLIYKKEAP